MPGSGGVSSAAPSDELITCPFCGLICDDLVASGDAVDVRGCAMAAAGFARRAAPRRAHRVRGEPVDLATAAAAAAAILSASDAPLIHGLTADLHGIRGLLALAERVGAAVDHRNSPALLANAAVARASGWVTATFAEVANRADFILLVGGDPSRSFPRFHERLIGNKTPLYREAPPAVAYLGPVAKAPPLDVAPLRAALDEADLLHGLGALSALLSGRGVGDRPGRLPADALARIAAQLAGARYGVIAWDISADAAAEAELAVELIASMLRRLNATTRCVGLPLGGSGNGLGALQAALWQTGWPLRIGFGDGTPRHDPWRYDGRRMLAAGEADALVWTAALIPEAPPATTVPVIAIVADDVDLSMPAAVEIRVGIPGIDHAGEVVRADTVIALPLQASRPSDRPRVGDAAYAILSALEAGA